MVLPRHSVSSSVGFSPSPRGEARLFLQDQEPDGVRNQAAPMKQLRLFRWFSAIKSSNSFKSLTPPTDQYGGSICRFHCMYIYFFNCLRYKFYQNFSKRRQEVGVSLLYPLLLLLTLFD